MNAPVHHPLQPDSGQSDAASAAIGRLIVACAGFEAKLTLLMKVIDRSASPRLLPSQKIKAIRDAMQGGASDTVAPRQHGRIRIILLEAETILSLRAECAHSGVVQALVNGETRWLLRNAQLAGDPLDRCVMISPAEIAEATARIKQLANQLKQILNPPLPPQPKPDAAAGP